jgi:hypothetical protein
MKKLNSAEKDEKIKSISKESDLYMLCANDLALDQFKYVCTRWLKIGYSRLTGANGGILVCIERIKDQTPNVHFTFLDTELEYYRNYFPTDEDSRTRRKLIMDIEVIRNKEINKMLRVV